MSWKNSTTPAIERFYASVVYLLPLLDSLIFGRFLFQQFPPLQLLFVPLLPLVQLYRGIPFSGLIIFFVLLFAVVRNENVTHFIRFNTMQAILLDIIVMVGGLIVNLLSSSLQLPFIVETITNMIFLGSVAAFVYALAQSVMGRYAEIPAISEAVNMQVR